MGVSFGRPPPSLGYAKIDFRRRSVDCQAKPKLNTDAMARVAMSPQLLRTPNSPTAANGRGEGGTSIQHGQLGKAPEVVAVGTILGGEAEKGRECPLSGKASVFC